MNFWYVVVGQPNYGYWKFSKPDLSQVGLPVKAEGVSGHLIELFDTRKEAREAAKAQGISNKWWKFRAKKL